MLNRRQAIPTAAFILTAVVFLWVSNGYVWVPIEEDKAISGPVVAGGTEPDIVARVNGEPVTRLELDRMLANPLIMRQAQLELGVEEQDPRELERLALRRLIHLRLLAQEAGRRKVAISQKELDEAVAELRRRFEDLKSFGEWIQNQGLDEPSLFTTIRTDMLSDRVSVALVEGVEVSEEEVQQYFEAHKNDLSIGTEVRLRIIAVSDKSEAEDILAAVQKGVPFDRLARQRSQGRLATRGGDTGWTDFKALPPVLQEAAAKLREREVAGPFEKGEGEFLIVGLQGQRPIRPETITEAKPEIERRLLFEKRQETLRAWLEEREKSSETEVFLQIDS